VILAIKAVCKKEIGHLAAAKCNLLPSTLCYYFRSNWDTFQGTQSKLVPKPVIPPALQEKLVECLLLTERKYFGCTPDDVRRPAFQLAVHNKISSSFPIAKEAAGKY